MKMIKPRCLQCHEIGWPAARDGSFFCTKQCAANYAEMAAFEKMLWWCSECLEWIEGTCEHTDKEYGYDG